MQLQKLLSTDEEQAVSPVIGVILMVAITVILAAVIASFVLGLGSNQEVAPTATFDFNYDTDDSSGEMTVTHTGGDNIRGDRLYIRGNDIVEDTGAWDESPVSGDESTEIEGESAVTSGDSATIDLDDSDTGTYVIRVVWESSSGGSSSELASDRGPDA